MHEHDNISQLIMHVGSSKSTSNEFFGLFVLIVARANAEEKEQKKKEDRDRICNMK